VLKTFMAKDEKQIHKGGGDVKKYFKSTTDVAKIHRNHLSKSLGF